MKKNWFLYGLSFLGALVLFMAIGGFVISLVAVLKSGKKVSGPAIGVLKIKGVILDADNYLEDIRELERSSNVKAVVVRIESPGGSVGSAQEIFEELLRLGKKKPVVVSMGNVAASGGYYVALAGKEIYALPGTLTGSIGVIIEIPNIKKLMDKLGIQTEAIKTGPYKDTGAFYRPLTQKEKEYLKKKVENILNQFVSAIVKQRHLPLKKVKEIADGRIFTGEEAKKLGLIDKLGNFWDAVSEAAKLAGIKHYTLVTYPRKKSFFEKFLETKNKDYIREVKALVFKPLYLAVP